MIKYSIVLLLAGLQLFTVTARAGQSADLVCVNNTQVNNCEVYELHVKVTSDEDVGQFGAFGIFAELTQQDHLAYWRVTDGWSPFTEENILLPVDGFFKKLPTNRDYVVYRGTLEGICKLSGGSSFNLYAGHGMMTPEKIHKLQLFLHKFSIIGIYERNFWNMILLKDAIDNKKGSLVFSHNC